MEAQRLVKRQKEEMMCVWQHQQWKGKKEKKDLQRISREESKKLKDQLNA